MLREIENIWCYFFDLEGSLDQKKYIKHFFLDLLFFVALIYSSYSLIVYHIPINMGMEEMNVYEALLSTFVMYMDILVCLMLLYCNRISIIIRRLNHLKISRLYVLLGMIPFVSVAFEIFLMLPKLEKIDLSKIGNDFDANRVGELQA